MKLAKKTKPDPRTRCRVFKGWFNPAWDMRRKVGEIELHLWKHHNGVQNKCKITVEWSDP